MVERVRSKRSYYGAYADQRRNARRRGIRFDLSFDDWFAVWVSSGHLAERGRTRGKPYVMARFGDCGPYAVGNIKIIRLRENLSEETARQRHKQGLGLAHKAAWRDDHKRRALAAERARERWTQCRAEGKSHL